MKTKKPRTLDDEELDAIFAHVHTEYFTQRRNAALLALMEATGLRVSEALALKTTDIVLIGGPLWKVVVPDGEGCKTGWREVPFVMNKRMTDYFLPWYYHDVWEGDYVFVTSNGNQLTPSSFRRWLHRKACEAGLTKNVTPHMLRHTYATRRVQAGWERPAVQLALGHKSPSTTDIYFHSDIRRLVELVGRDVT